jgi:hypothetical protein
MIDLNQNDLCPTPEAGQGLSVADAATPGFQSGSSRIGSDAQSASDGLIDGASESPRFFPAQLISEATTWDKKTIHRHAAKQNWPMRQVGNRFEYLPPAELAAKCSELATLTNGGPRASEPKVRFNDLTHDEDQRKKVLLRKEAVLFFKEKVAARFGIEFSLSAAVTHIYRRATEEKIQDFQTSTRTLREWVRKYDASGIDGLVEQKLGIVGRTSVMSKLSKDDLETVVMRGKAIAIEKGFGGKPNVAAAFQEMATQPDLPSELREHCHSAHVSKSYVTPSFRQAVKPGALTTVLAQMGTRAARLSSTWTPGDYSQVRAGDVWVSDDMTDNVYSWTEANTPWGFMLTRAQLLPVLDVGSLRWLGFRLIYRRSGQYNSDDIWGLFGDMFDQFGMPRHGFLLEGGHWRSDKVIGKATGLSDEERLGGLASLGLRVWHAKDARGKSMLEGYFHVGQFNWDRSPGFGGREQRKDANEKVQTQLRLCTPSPSGAYPHCHPKEFFPHATERANFIAQTMANLNNTRNDGQILRGQLPIEKWSAEEGDRTQIPDSAKWMYRSAKNVTELTRNGLRVTVGSGKNLQPFWYDNRELLAPFEYGTKFVIHWDQNNPDVDAVILTHNPKSRKFLGIAQRVKPLHRFTATKEELAAEAQRRGKGMQLAREELRSIQPELQRPRAPIATDAGANRIGEEISQAAARVDEKKRVAKQTRAEIRKVEITDADREAAIDAPSESGRRASDPVTIEEITNLFNDT